MKARHRTDVAIDRLMSGLATVAAVLNANDQCLARIAAVHLRIPDLPHRAARDAMEAENRLVKSAHQERADASVGATAPDATRKASGDGDRSFVLDQAGGFQARTIPSIRAGRPGRKAAAAENSVQKMRPQTRYFSVRKKIPCKGLRQRDSISLALMSAMSPYWILKRSIFQFLLISSESAHRSISL